MQVPPKAIQYSTSTAHTADKAAKADALKTCKLFNAHWQTLYTAAEVKPVIPP